MSREWPQTAREVHVTGTREMELQHVEAAGAVAHGGPTMGRKIETTMEAATTEMPWS